MIDTEFGTKARSISMDNNLNVGISMHFFIQRRRNRYIPPLDVVPEQGKVCVAGVVGLGSDIPYLGEGGDILKIRG
jgi:hypothetical protein